MPQLKQVSKKRVNDRGNQIITPDSRANKKTKIDSDFLNVLAAVSGNEQPLDTHDADPALAIRVAAPEMQADSVAYLLLLNEWKSLHFSSPRDGAEAYMMVKFAHSLLFAAVALRKEEGEFQNKTCNPAIQLVVKLFFLASDFNARKAEDSEMQVLKLALAHVHILKSFIANNFFKTRVLPAHCIKYLHEQFAQVEPTASLSLRGISMSNLADTIFRHLEAVLSVDDYSKVVQISITHLEKDCAELRQKQTMPASLLQM